MFSQLHHQVRVGMGQDRVMQRRDFLRSISAASVAAGALSWTDLMTVHAAELRRKEMACILLWMQGGPSQFETFSPRPGHKNGGPTKAISTAVPGIEISENYPHVAKQMKEIAIIRSMTTKEGSHPRATFLMHTGNLPTPTVKYPSLGAVVSHQIGDPESDLPGFVQIGNRGRGKSAGGLLGVEYDPFVIRQASQRPANTEPTTSSDRYRKRLDLLNRLETDYAAAGGKQTVSDHKKLYDKASRMVLSSEMQAFDLEQEPAAMRDAYGRTQFGSGCLLARRLIESGVTFVEVQSGGWDTHADNFNRVKTLSEQVDQPMAQLIEDLRQRGMLEKTLILWMGEFGRTPRINGRAGRDHYPKSFNIAMAGGGVRGGQVIGSTDKDGLLVAERPVTVPDLFRSICSGLQIDPDHENMSPIGRPIKIVEGGTVIQELFS